MHFLPVGHTKFYPDLCFGLFKRRFRKSDCYSLADVVKIAEKSCPKKKTITPILVGDEEEVFCKRSLKSEETAVSVIPDFFDVNASPKVVEPENITDERLSTDNKESDDVSVKKKKTTPAKSRNSESDDVPVKKKKPTPAKPRISKSDDVPVKKKKTTQAKPRVSESDDVPVKKKKTTQAKPRISKSDKVPVGKKNTTPAPAKTRSSRT
ncbi:hypothetical protein U1Q18_050782 [Sarracenia purpurea var. burkii]